MATKRIRLSIAAAKSDKQDRVAVCIQCSKSLLNIFLHQLPI